MTQLRLVVYDKTTGNGLYNCSYNDNFTEPTLQQLHDAISNLQSFDVNYLGLLRFENGQYDDNFNKYPYHVDTTTNTIVWDTANPIGASLADVQTSKSAQIRDMYNQTMSNGFNVTIGTTQYTFGWVSDDITHMNATQTAVSKGFLTFPFNYADIHGNPVSIPDQATLDNIESTATKFNMNNHQQALNLVGQVQTATTVSAVNAIQWSAATY